METSIRACVVYASVHFQIFTLFWWGMSNLICDERSHQLSVTNFIDKLISTFIRYPKYMNVVVVVADNVYFGVFEHMHSFGAHIEHDEWTQKSNVIIVCMM